MRHIVYGFLAVLLALALYSCASNAETPSALPDAPEVSEIPETPAFVFTRENMPRLDGSTSTAPLAEAVCSTLLGESREAISDLVRFNKTTTAYYNLIWGNADLLIVGEYNAEILEEKERCGFEWERKPFATDAFIFVVNENNPVDSITIEEAKRIYTGEITNWNELGGEDCEIIPFQRNQEAGSQNIMEKLVMKGTPMMEAPSGFIVTSMGQLMEVVKNYDGSSGAIGYTVYYYAEEMKMAQGLKILALEGVTPNPETIRTEKYPLLNPKYVVIPADAPENAPNRVLFNWLLSEEGQKLVADEGYVAVLGETPARAVPLPVIGSRWYEEYTGDLIPSGDYGTLIPYAGLRLMDDWPSITGCLYGLMTENGIAVTDAVYSSVNRPVFYMGTGQIAHPLLVLRRGENRGSENEAESVYAIAAADGSWCTEFKYRFQRAGKEGVLLFTDDTVTQMAPNGEILRTLSLAEEGFTQEETDALFSALRWGEGYGGQWYGDYLTVCEINDYTALDLLHLPTGRREVMSIGDWNDLVMAEHELYEKHAQKEEIVPPDTDDWIDYLRNEFTDDGCHGLQSTSQYIGSDGVVKVFLPDGTPIPSLTRTGAWYYKIKPVGGLIEVLDLNTASYYDRGTMECVFRTYLGYEAG